MRRIALASGLILALGLSACAGAGSPSTPQTTAPTTSGTTTSGATAAETPTGTPGETTPTPGPTASGDPQRHASGAFATREAATLKDPWAMEFVPGTDQLLITQKSGELLLRDQRSGETITVSGTPEVVDAGQGGFGDVVVAPSFEQDQTIYLSWAERGDGGNTGAVIGRAKLVTDGSTASLDGLTVIWRQDPKVSGNGHFAHRIAFSPDGQHMFVTSGDRQKMTPAQDLNSGLGKVLRLNPDGTPAEGNPFADRGGVSAQIWSYGHRNPLGIAFDADGNLWSSEMGPQGGDEINLILEGKNYGWPNASNGSHYGGGEIPDHAPGDGFEAPKVWWNSSISPSSLMIYSGDVFPQWQGDAFVGALSGQALLRVGLNGTDATKGDEWDMGQRIRDVAQAPDGTIWLIEDGSNGRLLQIVPA
ncbi:PQQ-dependent sugar dehydrogenase [Ammonicoccus fulvus]|uniref:PQQ-dependent sugar dehydrogenase n=1 Tax=Ammonicoccus fulvus TaxID=3138240 RepID=A0ABZ3FUB3_9ACTN